MGSQPARAALVFGAFLSILATPLMGQVEWTADVALSRRVEQAMVYGKPVRRNGLQCGSPDNRGQVGDRARVLPERPPNS